MDEIIRGRVYKREGLRLRIEDGIGMIRVRNAVRGLSN